MLFTDVRAVFAVVVVIFVALFGEVWFSFSYLGAGLVLTMVAFMFVVDSKVDLRPEEWAGLGVVVWGVMSAYCASEAWLDSKTTLASWFGAWLIWVVISRATRAGRRMVRTLLLVAAVVAGGVVVAEFIGSGTPRAVGLTSNPNITVALVASVLVFAVSLFRHRWVGLIAGLVLASPVVLTGSRAGVLAAGAVGLVVLPRGANRRVVIGLGGLGLGFAAAWRLFANPESLAWHRWRIWGAVLEMISDRPFFGIGAGHLGEAMGPYRIQHPAEFGIWGHIIGTAESMPLGLAARIGLPGLVLFLLVVGFWIHRRRSVDTSALGVLAAIVIVGLFHDFLSEPAVLWWWAAVVALVTPRPLCSEDGCRVHAWRVLSAVATAGVASWALLQPMWAMHLWWSGEVGYDAVERVVRVEPWYSEPMKTRVEELLTIPGWTWEEASEARYWTDRLLEVRPRAAWVWALRGFVDSKVVNELGAWKATIEEARSAFSSAAALEPHLPWYPYHHAALERSLGQLERARNLVRSSVVSEPHFVRGWLLLARLHIDLGDLAGAREARSRARVAIEEGQGRARTAYHLSLLEHSRAQLRSLELELQ